MPAPTALHRSVYDFLQVRRHVLVSACAELGLLAAIDTPREARALARDLHLDLRAATVLLRALVEAGLARAEGTAYGLTDEGRRLVADPDFSEHGFQLDLLATWAKLPQVARSGKPLDRPDSPERLARFMAAMNNRDPGIVASVVDAVEAHVPRGRLMDLGGGPGTFSRAFAARGWNVTLADRPEVIAHVVPAYGLAEVERLTTWGGDLTHDLPDEDHDTAFLANITHMYSPQDNRNLLQRLSVIHPETSAVVIVDFLRGECPTAELFAVNMLVHTAGGDTYSQAEYADWLRDVGFGAPVVAGRVGGGQHVLVAKRA